MSDDTRTDTKENLSKFLVLKSAFQYVTVDKAGEVTSGGRITGTYEPTQVELAPELKEYCDQKGGKAGIGVICQLPKGKRAKCTLTNTVQQVTRPGMAAPMLREIGPTHIKCALMD